VPLTFLSAKSVKYWNGSSWVGSQDFGAVKMWNGSTWQYVGIRPYADVALVTFSPDGGTSGSPTFDTAEAYGGQAGYTITASSSVVWTWDNGGGGFNGYASVASGSSASSIELVAAYTGSYNEQTFNVSASNGAETKYWVITVISYSFE
jgi:hypothetical protein